MASTPIRISGKKPVPPSAPPASGGHKVADNFGDDPRWLLVQRVLQSKGFVKSQRPSDFLLHVCRKALRGDTGEISEQDIGESIFARREGFDPGLDNIVRVTARRVRQKLDEYFAGEGIAEPMVLSMPVGGYVPHFDPRVVAEPEREVEVAAPQPVVAEPAPAVVSSEKKSSRSGLWVGAIAALAIACAALAAWHWRPHAAPPATPASRMWASLLDPSGRTIFVPGDSALVLLENHLHRPVSLSSYMDKSFLEHLPGSPGFTPEQEREEALRPYNSVVDVRFSARLARLPEARKPVDIVLARDLRMEDMKESNVILSGAREANPWVQMFEDQLNFQILDRQEGDNYSVVNRHPQGNEPAEYKYDGRDPQHIAYGCIAYLPNLSGHGKALLVRGTTMVGTEAAMEFVFDPERLNAFLSEHLQDGRVPDFELLLKTTNLDRSSTKSQIIGYRIH